MMVWAPIITDFIPEAQTLLMSVQGRVSGNPAPRAARRAGACPRLAETTLPKNNSSTCSGAMPARCRAARMAALPSSTADREERAPPKLPMGVRTAAAMYTVFMP
jgi:hypothetical protein